MTRKTKRIIIVVVVLVICTGAAIGYKMYNKPFKDAMSGKAIVVTAEQLLADFENDEVAAREKYVPKSVGDKVLELSGQVKETGINATGETFYVLKAGGEMAGVKCVMEKAKENIVIKTGENIKIRGFCNGYLADEMIPGVAEVIVNRCKVVNE
ncbi:MAG: hypothetical protein ABIQ56_01200 [Chitinophagaceae bacterium]